MKNILTILYDASATLQDVHNDLATSATNLESDYVVGNIKYAIEQLSKVLVAAERSEEPVKEKKETLEEFIQRVADSYEFAHETIKDMWVVSLGMAIQTLESRRGYAGCHIPTVEGILEGRLSVSSSLITFTEGGNEFLFEKNDNVASAEVEENDNEEDNEDRWEEEESPCDNCGCVAFCRDEMTLLDYIQSQDDSATNGILLHLQLIEDELQYKTEFSTEDYALVRYYLKQNPNTSVHEVDALSDRGLHLAWNAHMYLIGKIR